MLIGTAACSGSSSSNAGSGDKKASETPGGSTTGQPVAESSNKSSDPVLPDITAPQVLAGLKGAGYKCGADGTYAICTSGTVAVWVLTGTHPRPPVVSLHATGQLAPAQAAIAAQLPKVLEIAHINPRTPVTDWFGKLGATENVLKSGDWQADWSVETVDTEEPGVHLTLVDQTCKVNCQAE